MISVCIATYNGARFLERQLKSILCQLGPDDEVVVSDDGSTDETIALLQAMNDARIRIVEGPHRHSPIWNFERSLSLSKGDYIFLSDQDDEWLPNKVAVCMDYLKYYDCVVSDCQVVDGTNKILHNSFYQINGTRKGSLYNLLVKNGYLGCCMAFRRQVLDKALPFPMRTPMHDIWLGNVAAFRYSLCFIPDKLVLYTRHGGNASSASDASRYSLWNKLCFRWTMLLSVLRLLF